MKEPVDHIARPELPWRNGAAITECGLDASKAPTISRHDYFKREKELGQQRTAMLTCMTCSSTAKRWGSWSDDPRHALGREIDWERGGGFRERTDRGHLLKDELQAIAILVDAHKDEFTAAIEEMRRRREWIDKKAALDRKPKYNARSF